MDRLVLSALLALLVSFTFWLLAKLAVDLVQGILAPLSMLP